MGNIMWGIVFLLAGVVLVWLGIRQRKRAQRDYEDDVRRYTASTVMTVVHLDESVLETWEDRDDCGRELRRETVYQPTYEYTAKRIGMPAVSASPAAIWGGRSRATMIPLIPPASRRTGPENRSWADFSSSPLRRSCCFLPIGPLRESFTFPEYIAKKEERSCGPLLFFCCAPLA